MRARDNGKYWQSDEFQKLNRKWNRKLKQVGFKDIEVGCELKPNFKYDSSTQEYYDQCRSYCHSYEFPDETHRTIWQLHSEGHSLRQIESKIRRIRGVSSFSHEQIRQIINSIEADMLSELS